MENIISMLNDAVKTEEIRATQAMLEFEMNRLNQIEGADAVGELYRIAINALMHKAPTQIQIIELIELETLTLKTRRLFK